MRLPFDSKILINTQNTILSAAFVLSIASGINALLGFLKGRFLAYFFGVSNDLAIFYTADKIPNLIYSVLVVGAISTVFIPIFSDYLKENAKKVFEIASSIVNATLILFLSLGIVIYVFSPQIISTLSIGKFTPEEVTLGTNLMRIMLVAQLILVGGSLTTSILQSFKYFLIPALAPVFYNLGMIAGIVLLSPKYGIYGPAYGVVIGAILHLGIQLPLIKKTGFNFSFSLDFKNSGVKEMFSLVPPRLMSVLLANVVGTINNSLAILVSTSSVVFLKFATQLQNFPVSLFGLSIATACLPTLSQVSDKDNTEKFKDTFITSFHQTMFLVLPLSVILLVLKVPVVRIVYGVSNFPWEATIKTAYVLAFFSISIFAQSANYLLTRSFYALKDTKTPVFINLFTIFLNVLISVGFVVFLKLGVWSVALAFSITSITDMLLYFIFLSKKLGGFDTEKLLKPFTKISYATLLMGVALYVPIKALDDVIFDTSRTINLLILCGIAGIVGMTTYLLLTKLFKVEEIELFYKVLRKLKLVKTLDTQVTPQV